MLRSDIGVHGCELTCAARVGSMAVLKPSHYDTVSATRRPRSCALQPCFADLCPKIPHGTTSGQAEYREERPGETTRRPVPSPAATGTQPRGVGPKFRTGVTSGRSTSQLTPSLRPLWERRSRGRRKGEPGCCSCSPADLYPGLAAQNGAPCAPRLLGQLCRVAVWFPVCPCCQRDDGEGLHLLSRKHSVGLDGRGCQGV